MRAVIKQSFYLRYAIAGLVICMFSLSIVAFVQRNQLNEEWRSYGADVAGSKYASINQIHAGNADQLEVAWRWSSIDEPILAENSDWLWTWRYEATPIMIDGVLYTSTSLSQVAALDAATGNKLWSFDPGKWTLGSPPNNGFLHRGVAYWDDGEDGRVYIGTGHAELIALDARTGELETSFAETGRVDLTQGLRRSISTLQYGVSSPPVVCNDIIVVGSSIWDYPFAYAMAPGDVRAFDARTGALKWVFESVPQGEDFGSETWTEEAAQRIGNTNVWAPMSCDEENGLVYLPFGTPTNDYYGGERPGDNLFGETLVALDIDSGERAWHYQMVRHGIWDYDLPAAPNLLDVTIDGTLRQVVAQVTKHGFLFVLDRLTGEPIWPIEDKSVPTSSVPGEQTAATQPFPTKPAPFEQQGVKVDDLIDFTDALHEQARSIISPYTIGPLFTPPSLNGTITMPGVSGGGSWAAAAVHPESGQIYVPSIRGTWTYNVWRSPSNSSYAYKGAPSYGPSGPLGLPLMKPPYGSITAIDLKDGEHMWKTAVGEGPRQHSALLDLDLPRLGWARRIFVALTDSVLFAGQEGINVNRGSTPRRNASEINTINSDPALWVFSPETGELLTKIPLPSNASGAPMTYMWNGVQYVVVPIGGASQTAELVALTLDPALIEVGLPSHESTEQAVRLESIYPIPANNEVSISFVLAESMRVKITLYDLLGKQISVVSNVERPAGRNVEKVSITHLAAGTYFYRLETPMQELGGQMVVVR